jgi:hypothetical protein
MYTFIFLFVVGVKQTASVVLSSEFLATDPDVRVEFPTLPDVLRSSESGTGFSQLCEYD